MEEKHKYPLEVELPIWEKLKNACKKNRRSINKEVNHRLEKSFKDEEFGK